MRQHTKYTLQQIGVVAFIILVVYAVFRHGDIGYDFHWAVLWEVNPTYKEIFGVWLLKGLYLTIKISLISTGIALLLGTIFGIESADENMTPLVQQIQASDLTIGSGLALLVFFAIALQCVSTLAILSKESASRSLALKMFVAYLLLAYAAALAIFHIAGLFGG